MPGIVRPSNPVLIMPDSLSSSFEESHSFVSLINTYPDGSSTRKTLHDEVRKKWVLSKRLRGVRLPSAPGTPSPLEELHTLWLQTRGGADAFFFYNFREAEFDPTGVTSFGRYTVVFRGVWTEVLTIGQRSNCSFSLEEVE